MTKKIIPIPKKIDQTTVSTGKSSNNTNDTSNALENMSKRPLKKSFQEDEEIKQSF